MRPGGSRLELGNGDSMLHVEYYPDDKIPMDDALKASIRRMADFVTAYENLLRDGQTRIQRTVEIQGNARERTGESDAVWDLYKSGWKHTKSCISSISAEPTMNGATRRGKSCAASLERAAGKILYAGRNHRHLASFPDEESAVSISLIFEKGEDDNGRYLEFEVPSLPILGSFIYEETGKVTEAVWIMKLWTAILQMPRSIWISSSYMK